VIANDIVSAFLNADMASTVSILIKIDPSSEPDDREPDDTVVVKLDRALHGSKFSLLWCNDV
jgi:hypothetical protein